MGARGPVAATVLVLALCAWSAWASGFHHSTAAAFATWAASLAGVVVVDALFWQGRQGRRPAVTLAPAVSRWPWPDRRGGSRVLVGLSPWFALALVVLAWEVLGIDTGTDTPHLTISALAQAYRPLDAALLVVWILVGVGFGAARARAPYDQATEGTERAASAGALPVMAASPHRAVVPALLLPHSRAIGVAFWIAVVVAGLAADLVARRSAGRLATAEEFVRFVSRPPPARVLLIAAWTFAGWHLFAH